MPDGAACDQCSEDQCGAPSAPNNGRGGHLALTVPTDIAGCKFTAGPSAQRGVNDVHREDGVAVTFSCAKPSEGSPVQMIGNDTAVLPPAELNCTAPA